MDVLPRADRLGGDADGVAVLEHLGPFGNGADRDLVPNLDWLRQPDRAAPDGNRVPRRQIPRGDTDIIVRVQQDDIDERGGCDGHGGSPETVVAACGLYSC